MRLCQTMAGATGRPVARSQTTVVSRWFVTPMAATLATPPGSWAMASLATASWLAQMSSGSCVTWPGKG